MQSRKLPISAITFYVVLTATVAMSFTLNYFLLWNRRSKEDAEMPLLAALPCPALTLRDSTDNRKLESVTISVGVASYPQHGTTQEALLRSADQRSIERRKKVVTESCLPDTERLYCE